MAVVVVDIPRLERPRLQALRLLPRILGNNGSYAASFHPHVLTAHVAQQGKPVRDNILGSDGGPEKQF